MLKRNIKSSMLVVLALVFALSLAMFIVTSPKQASAATRYEAETATVTNGTVKLLTGEGSYAQGASGTGFVGMNDANDSAITFTVNVTTAGTYKLAIKYASGSSNVAVLKVTVGSTLQGWVQCPMASGSGWGGFNTSPTKYINVGLAAGANTVTIGHVAWVVEIDYIEVGDKLAGYQANPLSPTGTKYEAENATVTDCNKKEGDDGYAQGVSGTGFVADMDLGTSAVTFNVTVSAAGTYDLFIKYASGSSGTTSFKVSVNGGTASTVELTSLNGWGSFNVTPVAATSITLSSTTATVKVQKGDLNAQIDYIVIGSGSSSGSTTPATGYTRYEAEKATLVGSNAVVKPTSGTGSYAYGVSGTGFVGDINEATDGVSFSVTASEKAKFAMNIKYASGSSGMPSLKVYVNDVLYTIAYLPTTNGWGSFNTTTAFATTISLQKGANTVKLLKGAHNVELDYIEIGAKKGEYLSADFPSVSAPSGTILYEAEKSNFEASEIKTFLNGTADYASGVSGVGFIGLNDAGSIQFSVSVPAIGKYKVQVKCAGEAGTDVTFDVYTTLGKQSTQKITGTNMKGWGAFSSTSYYSFEVGLQPNDLIVIKQVTNYMEVDYITVAQTKTSDYTITTSGKIEAETCRLSNVNVATTPTGFSGAGYVTNFKGNYTTSDTNTNAAYYDYYLELDANVTAAGNYTVKVRYACASATTMYIYAGEYGENNRWQAYGSYSCTATGGLTTFTSAMATFTVGLKQKDTFIRISGKNFSIDYITISTTYATFTQGTNVETIDSGDNSDIPNLDATYTVKFNANGGSGTMANQTINYYTATALTANAFTKTGYTFKGWATTQTGAVAYNNKASVNRLATSGTVNLYAIWQANTYTIAFNANGGSGTMSNLSATYDTSKALTSNTFTKTGYTFQGWATSATGTATYTNAQSVKNLTATNGATVTLYAVWKANTYTIAFNANDGEGTMSNLSATYDTAQNLTANAFTKTGYVFKGWATTATGTVAYTNEQSVKNLTETNGATVTLYAIWQAGQYTIVYNNNNGSGTMANQIVTYDETANLTENTFTRTGYTFQGWSTTSEGTVEYENQASITNLATANETKTLYAVWQANTYTIAFNNNGGSGSMDSVGSTYDVELTLPANTFEKENYVFLGWSLSETDTTIACTDKQNVKNLTAENGATVTLYAVWIEETASTYFVEFNGNNATNGLMGMQLFIVGEQKSLLLNEYVKTGYEFMGWATVENGEVVYEDGEQVTDLTTVNGETVTLYAVWNANSYVIAFNSNGGIGSMDSINATYGVNVTLNLNTFTNEGYIFKGWAITEDGEVVYEDCAQVINLTATDGETVTLYAVWELEQVTPNPDDGDNDPDTDNDNQGEGSDIVEEKGGCFGGVNASEMAMLSGLVLISALCLIAKKKEGRE